MRSYLAALRRRLRSQPCLDLPFLCILLLLLSLGLLMLFSAGYAVALYRRGDAYTYIRPQLLFAALGLVAMYAASLVDYHIWHKLAWPLMGLSLLLLVVVLFMPEYNGCKRWIVLPGLGTLQPSEIAKFAVVLVFAHIISLNHSRMGSFGVGVLPFVLVLGVVATLMLLEPHLSGTVLILCIGAVLMFVLSVPLNYFVVYPAYVKLYDLPLEAIIGMYQSIRPSTDGLLECLLVFNMPFTFFKGLLDVALCFLIYKPLSPLLHK